VVEAAVRIELMAIVVILKQVVVARFRPLVIIFRQLAVTVGFGPFMAVAIDLRSLVTVVVAILESYFSFVAIITFIEHTSITFKDSFISFDFIGLLTI